MTRSRPATEITLSANLPQAASQFAGHGGPDELIGRSAQELDWFRRRSFLQAASTWVALGGWGMAHAQQRSNVVSLKGDALLNGRRLAPGETIQTGDMVQTGPGANLVFVIGNSSFLVRQNTLMTVERGASLFAVSVLRLISGGVASVWGKGSRRQIVTPTLTAGIRGTGVYTEVFPDQGDRSYFCNCYGTVDLNAGTSSTESQAVYHQSFWAEPEVKNGTQLTPARAINHTDDELEYLAALVDQRTAWQIMGKRGEKDGQGMIDGARRFNSNY
jgi:hypothetical protein